MSKRKTRKQIVCDAAYKVMQENFLSQMKGRIPTEEDASKHFIGYFVLRRGVADILKPRQSKQGLLIEENGRFGIHDAFFLKSLADDDRFNMRKETIQKSGEIITVFSPLRALDFILELGPELGRPTKAKIIQMTSRNESGKARQQREKKTAVK